jgi:hypothetical protein
LGEGLLVLLKAPALAKLELFSIPDHLCKACMSQLGRVKLLLYAGTLVAPNCQRYAYTNARR